MVQSTAGVEYKEGGIANKQKGISTTETKHSYDFEKDEKMPKKGDGSGPDTAKAQGTVDPGRSQREKS